MGNHNIRGKKKGSTASMESALARKNDGSALYYYHVVFSLQDMSSTYIERLGQCISAWIDHLVRTYRYSLCFFEKQGCSQRAICLCTSSLRASTGRVAIGFRFSSWEGTIYQPNWRYLASVDYEPTIPTGFFAQLYPAQFLLSWRVSSMATCVQQMRSRSGMVTGNMETILGINVRKHRDLHEIWYARWGLLLILTKRLPRDIRSRMCLILLYLLATHIHVPLRAVCVL